VTTRSKLEHLINVTGAVWDELRRIHEEVQQLRSDVEQLRSGV